LHQVSRKQRYAFEAAVRAWRKLHRTRQKSGPHQRLQPSSPSSFARVSRRFGGFGHRAFGSLAVSRGLVAGVALGDAPVPCGYNGLARASCCDGSLPLRHGFGTEGAQRGS